MNYNFILITGLELCFVFQMNVTSLDMCLLQDHFWHESDNFKFMYLPGFFLNLLFYGSNPWNAKAFALTSVLFYSNNYVLALI